MMNKLILASNNKHKIKEFKEMIKNKEILSLNDVGFFEEIEETGSTFEENATIKAKTVANFLKQKGIKADVVADDSGLCVEYLNGAPGVFSARYSGTHGNDQENRKKLLKELVLAKNRKAFFECCLVEILENGQKIVAVGKTSGEILDHEEGSNGFGYDPIFFSYDLKKPFGLATDEEKNSVSHRGRALKNLIELENKI